MKLPPIPSAWRTVIKQPGQVATVADVGAALTDRAVIRCLLCHLRSTAAPSPLAPAHLQAAGGDSNHLNIAQYQEKRYKIIPIVGTQQPTFQSAAFANGRLTVSQQLPSGIDALLDGGDGTVPYVSAIPIELSNEYRESFIAERHSSLQNNRRVLSDLNNRLKHTQIQGLEAIRGAEVSMETAARAAIRVDLDDLYLADEPVVLRAQLVNMRVQPKAVILRIEPVAAANSRIEAVWYAILAGNADPNIMGDETALGLPAIGR